MAFVNEGGTNQEGVYWRYEMWLRGRESALASVTAGNGAIYAVRPEAYIEVDPVMGHDLSFPFNMVKRGWRAVDVAGARATEKMVPSIEGEWVRKRRMMSHAWPIVLRGGLLDPRGYPPLYALMVLSHRVLRYATPLLHVVAALATLALLAPRAGAGRRARPGRAAGRRRGGRPRALAAAAARPLLRAHDRLAGRRALRPPAPRHRGGLGRAGGHPVNPYLSSRPQARARPARRGVGLAARVARCSPLAALAIRLEGGGHFIYRQRRVGRDGVPFDLYKLRTMVTGAETMGSGPDRRRRRRPDHEGRRAAAPHLARRAAEPDQRRCAARCRSSARARPCRSRSTATPSASATGSTPGPGITGWAQVNGRASLPWHERIELDLAYLDRASLRHDLFILAASVRMVFTGHGLYRGETGGWREPPPRAGPGRRPAKSCVGSRHLTDSDERVTVPIQVDRFRKASHHVLLRRRRRRLPPPDPLARASPRCRTPVRRVIPLIEGSPWRAR